MFFLLIPGPMDLFAEEPSSEAQRITSIINKVIDSYGGKEIIEGIHSVYAKGKIEALMLHDHGTYEFYFKRGGKLRVETKYERSSEVRILNNERGYRSANTLPFEEVYGPRFLSMVYQYKHLNILHDLSTGAYLIRSLGQSQTSSDNIEVFRLNDKEGTVMDISVAKQTFFIVKVAAYFKAENKQIVLSAEFSDFRKVGGSVFPFRITNYAGGLKIAQTVIEKYSLDPSIADSLFMPSTIQSL
jgi:outer membrane lipoprotein-sorting protein